MISKENSILRSENKSLKSKRLAIGHNAPNNSVIGFYVSKQATGDVGLHQTIEFENVHENHGNGYDKRHGHFTAPVEGLYYFSTTIYSIDGHEIHCELTKNGENVGVVYAPEPGHASSTLNVVVYLLSGDMVWVRHHWDKTELLNANNYSTFSGFLIN